MYKFKRTIVYVPYHSSVRLGRQFEDAKLTHFHYPIIPHIFFES